MDKQEIVKCLTCALQHAVDEYDIYKGEMNLLSGNLLRHLIYGFKNSK